MTEQVQQEATPANVQMGFGQALTIMFGENWRETTSEADINRARHFYYRGLNDMQMLVQISNAGLSQNVQSIFSTLAVGAEKQVAEQQAAAAAQAGEQTKAAIASLEPKQGKALSKAKAAKAPAKVSKAKGPAFPAKAAPKGKR